MALLLQEYENQHARRRYPFQDAATMTSTGGTRLPSDVVVDAFLYPIDLVGSVYLSQLDIGIRQITLQDSASDNIVGIATWAEADDYAFVYDNSGFDRCIGILTFGLGLQSFLSEGVLDFTAEALSLNPTCFVSLNQRGVRGLVSDDGQLVTGAVQLEGRNGVSIKTYISDGKNIARVDVRGEAPTTMWDCDENCTPIEQLKIENRNCSPIRGTHAGGGVLAITGIDFDLSDLCREPRLPDSDGNLGDSCDDPPGPGADWPCPDDSDDVVPVVDGRIEITAPSTIASDNPVHIETAWGLYTGPDSQLQGLNETARNKRMKQLLKLSEGIRRGRYEMGWVALNLKGYRVNALGQRIEG